MKNFILFFVFCLLGNSLISQATIEIEENNPTGTINSHLNGISRNHFEAYINRNPTPAWNEWRESQLDNKLLEYKNITNTFTGNNQRNVYRLGHNISDGNAAFGFGDFNAAHPGWHWASEYQSKGEPLTVLSGPSATVKVGAGVHRYYFKGFRSFSPTIRTVV